jgi:group II intron reverse transcriptase/maturase
MDRTSKFGNTVQTSLQGIAEKARREKKYRFRNLAAMLTEDYFQHCWKLLRKDAATGVDRVTAQEYGRHFTTNVRDLIERLKRGSYRAKLVLRKWIPKGIGKFRPLGLPALEDKLLQIAVALILRTIYEEDFLSCSYGYRLRLGARDAVKALKDELQFGRYRYVVEADIKGFFDNIDHAWMIRMLTERIDDQQFLRLIKKWLRAGILEEDGKVLHPVTGTPQGGIVSPVLANVYLHYALDLWFEVVVKKECKGAAYLCRYADDFVGAFEYKEDADRFYRMLSERLGKFKLTLSAEKTRVVSFSRFPETEGNSFDFLGFEFRWGDSRKGKRIVKLRTSHKKFQQSLRNFTAWCREIRSIGIRQTLKTLNAKLRGYYNYYGVIGNYESLNKYFRQTMRLLKKWLNRRSQKKSYNSKRFWAMMDRHRIERPRITEIHNGQRRLQLAY